MDNGPNLATSRKENANLPVWNRSIAAALRVFRFHPDEAIYGLAFCRPARQSRLARLARLARNVNQQGYTT